MSMVEVTDTFVCQIGGGCRVGSVDEALQKYGLGVTLGHAPSAGVGTRMGRFTFVM